MRITKDADERKNEILDIAKALFSQKGFDGTSISDILDKTGIARGTLYYHFKSKEEIMDALIEKSTMYMINRAQLVAEDKKIPVIERIIQVAMALNIEDEDGKEQIKHMHKPQNALMHQKMQKSSLRGITPIMCELVEEGISEGIFTTPFPYECMEMIMIYAITVFDDDTIVASEDRNIERVHAFIFNLERLLGAEVGSFHKMLALFGIA